MRSIRVYDSLTEWRWHTRPEIVSMFVHLLILASDRDKEVGTVKVRRGQLLTSLRDLSETTGISLRSTRTCLAHLEETGEIVTESTHQGTVITICKYVDYQGEKAQTDTRPTHDRHTTDTPTDEKSTHESTQQSTHRQGGLTSSDNASCSADKNDTDTRIDTAIDTRPTQKPTHLARANDLNNNNKNIDINKNLNKSCCCSRESADTREGFSFWSLGEQEQQAEQEVFYRIFFFENFRNIKSEIKRFIASNESHHWLNKAHTVCYDTPEQRRAIAELWRPESNNPRIPSPDFLQMWKRLYRLAEQTDPDVAHLMLDERVTVGEVADGRMFFLVHEKVWDWILDESNVSEKKTIINRFTKGKTIYAKYIY